MFCLCWIIVPNVKGERSQWRDIRSGKNLILNRTKIEHRHSATLNKLWSHVRHLFLWPNKGWEHVPAGILLFGVIPFGAAESRNKHLLIATLGFRKSMKVAFWGGGGAEALMFTYCYSAPSQTKALRLQELVLLRGIFFRTIISFLAPQEQQEIMQNPLKYNGTPSFISLRSFFSFIRCVDNGAALVPVVLDDFFFISC